MRRWNSSIWLVCCLIPVAVLADRRQVARPIIARPVSQVSLDVLVHGRPIRKIVHRGQTYLPVQRMGDEYALRLRNDGSRRVEVCIAVDGMSIMDRRRQTSQTRGYVLPPKSEVVIRGWRQNDRRVSAFCFADRKDSLAYRRDKPQHIGLITTTVHDEQRLVIPYPAVRRHSDSRGGRSADEGRSVNRNRANEGRSDEGREATAGKSRYRRHSARGDIGTAEGRNVHDPVDYTTFRRSGRARTTSLTYNLASKLAEAGIFYSR